MRQAIAGVNVATREEVEVMTVWPSNAAYGLGRTLGRLYSLKAGISVFTVGHLIALASIPIALGLYFLKILPFVGQRYTLTNRRIIVKTGIAGVEAKSVDLDRFDAIDIVVQPGQEWYHAGDLVFRKGNVETFRLEGVSRPRAFRSTCLKSHMSHVGVKKSLERQAVQA